MDSTLEQRRGFQRTWNRWSFDGTLTLLAPMHVGGAPSVALSSDAPMVRDGAGRPYLPGSTLKGAVRACVERLAPVVGGRRGIACCGLSAQEERCPSPLGSPAHHATTRALQAFVGSAQQRQEQLLRLLEERLCASCRLFGSPWLAGRVSFADALLEDAGRIPVEIRDGVGIDRDRGTAADQAHYSVEVAPSSLHFQFRVTAENVDQTDLALLALGVGELCRGAVRVGGGSSRGLGACRLELRQVQSLDLSHTEHLRAYLRDGTMERQDPQAWLQGVTDWLLGD